MADMMGRRVRDVVSGFKGVAPPSDATQPVALVSWLDEGCGDGPSFMVSVQRDDKNGFVLQQWAMDRSVTVGAQFCVAHPEDAVLCTLSDPNLVVHRKHKDCPQEGPHQWDECGVVHSPEDAPGGPWDTEQLARVMASDPDAPVANLMYDTMEAWILRALDRLKGGTDG